MRRILVTVGGTLAAVVAVFAYPTSTGRALTDGDAGSGTVATTAPATTATSAATTPATTTPATTAPSATASASPTPATTSGSGGSLASGTYSATSSMRYGSVTVTITVSGGKITDASATEDAADRKSQMISEQAFPVLNQEAVAAQSASISLVSHATYTSEAYEQSLQQAIDQAHGG